VVQEAYGHGVSTRQVDDLEGISRAEGGVPEPSAGGGYPYVGLDAKGVKVREGNRVVNMAAVVAGAGEREVLGFNVGPAESDTFWLPGASWPKAVIAG
jgi:transposase-like protein